jgi:hypothetical protein
LKEDGRNGRHALLLTLLTLAQPDGFRGRFAFYHGNALAVDRRDEELTYIALPGVAFLVEGLKVDAGIEHDLLGAALGNEDTVQIREHADRLVEWPLDGCLCHTPLDLVAVDSLRELKLGIERVDPSTAWQSVSHAGNGDLAEDGDQSARAEASVAIEERAAVGGPYPYHRVPVPGAASVDVLLK